MLIFNPIIDCSSFEQIQLKTIEPNVSSTTCYSDSTCWIKFGTYSRCWKGVCICDLGYRSMVNNGICTIQSCNFDFDCRSYFYNTQCRWKQCVCKYGTHLDMYSQTCLYNSGSSVGGIVGGTVGFIIIITVIVVLILIVRRRNQSRIVHTRVIQVPNPIQPMPNGLQYPQQTQQSGPQYPQYPPPVNPNYQPNYSSPSPPYQAPSVPPPTPGFNVPNTKY